MRNEDGVNRSALWTAWDAKTKVFWLNSKSRKILRRTVKRQQKQALQKQIRNQQSAEEESEAECFRASSLGNVG